MPSFVTHNDIAKSFTVSTDDFANEGPYTLTIINSIEVPDDWTQSSFTTIQAEVDLTIQILATCERTQFVDWILMLNTQVTANVQGDAKVIALGPVEDTVSRSMGS